MRLPILSLPLCLLSLFAISCSQKGTAITSDEPYTAVEPSIFPARKGSYVGDVMPFVHNGELELYYLYDTDHNAKTYHPIYLYTTKDFVHYTDCGEALPFGSLSDPDSALGTGSVLQGKDGLFHFFYTGHSDSPKFSGRECVMHATSTDARHWQKIKEDTFYSPDGYSKDDFRDPEVFWNEEEGCYWLLIAARSDKKGGVVARYTSQDLKHWTFCGDLFAPQKQFMLECPNICHINDRYYLFYSWDCVTYYAVSDSISGEFREVNDNVLDGTNFAFYAGKTVTYNNKHYLCAWTGRNDFQKDSGLYSWAGNLLIHEIYALENGSLGIREPQSIKDFFTKPKAFNIQSSYGKVSDKKGSIILGAKKDDFSLADIGVRQARTLFECDVTIEKNGIAGLAFGTLGDFSEYTALALDTRRNCIRSEGTKLSDIFTEEPVGKTDFTFAQNGTYHISLIMENEIFSLHVNGKKALSGRLYSSIDGAHIALFAAGAKAKFSAIKYF